MTETVGSEREKLTLAQASGQLLEESRMVLPGVQALFGFQLIAVFNSTFSDKLGPLQQRLHLLAISLVVIAIAIIMTPAAYHRITSPRAVSSHFIAASSRMLLLSMAPLALAVSIDLYVVAWLVVGGTTATVLAVFSLVVFGYMWFVLPRVKRARRLFG
jgi:hypothetical protein